MSCSPSLLWRDSSFSSLYAPYLSFQIVFGKSHLFSHHLQLFFSPWIWPLRILVKWDLSLEALLPFSTMSIISIMGLACRTFPHPNCNPNLELSDRGKTRLTSASWYKDNGWSCPFSFFQQLILLSPLNLRRVSCHITTVLATAEDSPRPFLVEIIQVLSNTLSFP